jgi:hypothetical protein
MGCRILLVIFVTDGSTVSTKEASLLSPNNSANIGHRIGHSNSTYEE